MPESIVFGLDAGSDSVGMLAVAAATAPHPEFAEKPNAATRPTATPGHFGRFYQRYLNQGAQSEALYAPSQEEA